MQKVCAETFALQRYSFFLICAKKNAPRGDFFFGLCRLRRGSVRLCRLRALGGLCHFVRLPLRSSHHSRLRALIRHRRHHRTKCHNCSRASLSLLAQAQDHGEGVEGSHKLLLQFCYLCFGEFQSLLLFLYQVHHTA